MDYTKAKIRKLRPVDIQAVGRLINRSSLSSLNGCPSVLIAQRRTANNIIHFLEGRELVEYFVAEIDNHILGVIGLETNEITALYVDPKHQRHGVGKLLYKKIRELVSRRKIKELTVKSTIVAVPVYEKFGFKIVERIWAVEAGRKPFTILMKQSF